MSDSDQSSVSDNTLPAPPDTSTLGFGFNIFGRGDQTRLTQKIFVDSQNYVSIYTPIGTATTLGHLELAQYDRKILRSLGWSKNLKNPGNKLAKENYQLLKFRLGDSFEKILTSHGVAGMFRGVALESNFDNQEIQDGALAQRIADASAVNLPVNIRAGEFVIAPLDMIPHGKSSVRGKNAITILELNGTGYGNITNIEKRTLNIVTSSFGNISNILERDPNALFVIGCSGREDPPDFEPSRKIHEKFMIASAMDSTISKIQGKRAEGAQIIGLDSFDENALLKSEDGKPLVVDGQALEKQGADKDGIASLMKTLDQHQWKKPTGPTIVVGYTAQLAKAIQIDDDGVPHLNGRQVSLINNDRLVLNINALNESKGKKLDPKKFIASNTSFLAGGDKGIVYAFANQFNGDPKIQAEFPEYSRHIHNDQAWSVDEVFDYVLAKLKAGIRPIIKPSGTGHGDGIVPFDLDERHDPESIKKQIHDSLNEVKGKYGDRGGFPYTISEYLVGSRIDDPNSDLDTMKYEYRIAVYADYTGDQAMLKAIPAIIKIDGGSVLQPGVDGSFSKRPVSISSQVRETGRPASDFGKALCNPKMLKLVKSSEEEMTHLCRWATRFVQYVLTNVDKSDDLRLPDYRI